MRKFLKIPLEEYRKIWYGRSYVERKTITPSFLESDHCNKEHCKKVRKLKGVVYDRLLEKKEKVGSVDCLTLVLFGNDQTECMMPTIVVLLRINNLSDLKNKSNDIVPVIATKSENLSHGHFIPQIVPQLIYI